MADWLRFGVPVRVHMYMHAHSLPCMCTYLVALSPWIQILSCIISLVICSQEEEEDYQKEEVFQEEEAHQEEEGREEEKGVCFPILNLLYLLYRAFELLGPPNTWRQ